MARNRKIEKLSTVRFKIEIPEEEEEVDEEILDIGKLNGRRLSENAKVDEYGRKTCPVGVEGIEKGDKARWSSVLFWG